MPISTTPKLTVTVEASGLVKYWSVYNANEAGYEFEISAIGLAKGDVER